MCFLECVNFLIPGYLFIESELATLDFWEYYREIKYIFNDVISLLRYGNTHEIAVRENERQWIIDLLNQAYLLEASRGIIVRDKVFVKAGPLMGYESKIIKIDRQKCELL
jgi:transcriptional antiterminator NusG